MNSAAPDLPTLDPELMAKAERLGTKLARQRLLEQTLVRPNRRTRRVMQARARRTAP